MKKIKIVLLLVIAFYSLIPAHELRTPKGALVNHTHLSDTGWIDGDSGWHTAEEWTYLADQRWGHLVLNRLERANRAYNCHAFAFGNASQGNTSSYCNIETNSELSVYWGDGSYVAEPYPTPFGSEPHPTHVNFTGGVEQQHSMIYENVSNNIVISKWGKYPVYRHELYSDPYLSSPSNTNLYRYYIINVPQECDLTYALNNVCSGQMINVTSNHTLNTIENIPDGVALIITSGVTLSLGTTGAILRNSSIYCVCLGNGASISNINAYLMNGTQATGYFASVQAALDHASTGNTIEIQSITSTESLNLNSKSNITITGLGINNTVINNGIYVTNSSYISINNMQLNHNVSSNNSQNINISNCYIPCATMLYDYYSSQNMLTNSSNGTEEQASSAITSYGGTGTIASNIIRRFDVGVFLSNAASYYVGTGNTFCNNGLDIYSPSPSSANAVSNNYSYALPNSVYGNVTTSGTNGICSLPKANVLQQNETITADSKLLKDADVKYLDLLRKIDGDSKTEKYDKSKYETDYSKLINDYMNVVATEKDKQIVKAALSKLNHLYKAKEDKNSFAAYLNELAASKANQQYLPYIQRYSIWDAVDNNDYNNSISVADDVLKNAINDEDLTCEMLYEKGLVYKYYLKNQAKAEEAFGDLISNHPKHLLAKYASSQSGIALKEQQNFKITESEESVSYSLDNYPNPFNPSTTISYSLPQAGHVTLKVYDVLGREVAELVNGVKEKGKHSVMFNASKYASGFYIYTIMVNDFYASKKMLLTK